MSDASEKSAEHFEQGFYCAESVLLSIAKQHGVDSPLIPGIATGLCSGMSRTGGTCGALTGAVLGLNLVFGRSEHTLSVEQNYANVQKLVARFSDRFGSTQCTELLGCHLGTHEGQQQFRDQNLGERCREYSITAATLADELIDRTERKAAESVEK